MDNIFLFIIFCFIIIIFLTFNVIELQNIGIILLITFFTAIAQEGEEFLLGAVLSGITAYLFIRLKTYFSSKNHKLDKCGISNLEYVKHKWNKLIYT
jgi:Na+/H+-translocating membrane pyrophosphatase